MTFWIFVIGLLAVALAFILLPMLRVHRSVADDQRVQQNIQIAREQKSQLDAQFEKGEIDQAAYDGALMELQTELAIELEQSEQGGDRSRYKQRSGGLEYETAFAFAAMLPKKQRE